MSDNVGLTTPRGSGTSGYVQRNLSNLRPRDRDRDPISRLSGGSASLNPGLSSANTYTPRKPDAGILEHERKRAIEAKVFALRVELEDAAAEEAEREAGNKSKAGAGGKEDEDREEGEETLEETIQAKCDAFRRKLLDEEVDAAGKRARLDDAEGNGNKTGAGAKRKDFKAHQVHEMAAAKIEESEKLRKALGISEGYQEGAHWRRQEEARADRADRARREEEGQSEDESGRSSADEDRGSRSKRARRGD